MITKDTIICRCEDITYGQVLEAIEMGMTTLDEIKRFLRAGMGPCQGRTCGRLIQQIICEKTGTAPGDVAQMTQRPPLTTVLLKTLAGDNNEE
ncbi:(2Fe-2S)-binding protein [bacterium]|nr:(2Fe-2S)-binding protein [bacterium]